MKVKTGLRIIHTSDCDEIQVIFHDCNAGWLNLDVTIGGECITADISYVFSPVDKYIMWLEKIMDGKESSWCIDEEGSYVEYNVTPLKTYDFVSITIDRYYYDIEEDCKRKTIIARLDSVVCKKQLIDAFYTAMKKFSDSDEYIPLQWEYETMGERLMKYFNMNEQEVFENLVLMNKNNLKELFFYMYEMQFDLPECPDVDRETGRFIQALDLFRRTVVCNKSGWISELFIEDEYDSWEYSRKKEYLKEFLNEQVNPYGGCKLKELRSARIEDYLAG